MIDALELDNLSVECKGVALYLHCLEARDVSERHELIAVLIQCYISVVDGRNLRVPLGDIEIVDVMYVRRSAFTASPAITLPSFSSERATSQPLSLPSSVISTSIVHFPSALRGRI